MLSLLLALAAATTDAAAADASGVMDAAFYGDSRGGGNVTAQLLVVRPRRVAFFSFVNLNSALQTDRPWELDTIYSEHHATWTPFQRSPLSLQVQAALASGQGNDALRGGVRWNLHKTPGLAEPMKRLGLRLFVNLSGPQLDSISDGSHRLLVEPVYAWTVPAAALDGRVMVTGFADQGLRVGGPEGDRATLVTEHQLEVRAFGGVWLVAEARYNGFMPEGLQPGYALGVKLATPWSAPPRG